MANLSPGVDTATSPESVLQSMEAEQALNAFDAEIFSFSKKRSESNKPDLEDAAKLAKMAVLL